MGQTLTHEAEAGAVLRAARVKKGITCRGLAGILGWDHSELSRIERGQATSMARYDAIAKALGMTLVIRFRRAA